LALEKTMHKPTVHHPEIHSHSAAPTHPLITHSTLSGDGVVGLVLLLLGVIALAALVLRSGKLKAGERLALAAFNLIGLGGGVLVWRYRNQLQWEPLVGVALAIIGVTAWGFLTNRALPPFTNFGPTDAPDRHQQDIQQQHLDAKKYAYTRRILCLSLLGLLCLGGAAYLIDASSLTLQWA
jgi:hypothetical protein